MEKGIGSGLVARGRAQSHPFSGSRMLPSPLVSSSERCGLHFFGGSDRKAPNYPGSYEHSFYPIIKLLGLVGA